MYLARVSVVLAAAGFANAAAAEQTQLSYSSFGTPGLIDMPTAQSAPDAELAATLSYFAGSTRGTLSFQIFPRLSGSFRYTKIDDWVLDTGDATFDRSFDLRYRLVNEGRFRPAVAIGLQDFIGTGIYSAEYIVATKHLMPELAVTAGIGWGRLGSYEGFDNPLGALDDRFETRPTTRDNTGGQIESTRWFRGDAAFFGGVSWAATDRLTFKAEYSSDDYVSERAPGRDLFERDTPLNFGVDYQVSDGVHLQSYLMHGTEIGIAATFRTNPRFPNVPGGAGSAPVPVQPRTPSGAAAIGWVTDPAQQNSARTQTATLLAADGMELEAMRLDARSATVNIRNTRYIGRAEAIGRTARILTRTLPMSVAQFTIVPMENGIPLSAVTLRRADLEELEFAPDGAWQSYARAQIADAAGTLDATTYVDDIYPRFRWSIGPYVEGSYFDPDNPVRLDFGAALRVQYDIAPGLIASALVQQRLIGNRDESTRSDPSTLPRVRSDANIYARADTAMRRLTLAKYGRPGTDLYGRVTLGYLETMYFGLSTELLWKPVSSRLALGVEVNEVRQRDFDQGFGLRDYQATTGHGTLYYQFENGLLGQVSAGRYLAGDWGSTIAVDRTFANGWRVGAYATFTDVSFDDFGEGSFDKGIRIKVPLQHFLGRPTARVSSVNIQPILRDGGARLNVDGRLYETLRSYHDPELQRSWGRFWR
ncbi:MAG: YjbH domain-containing protein [Pseudomonadota bacterium]